MGFNDSLKKLLKPETYSAVMSEVGDDFDWSVVPYSRFSTVVRERNAAREQLQSLESAGDGDPNKKFTQKDIDDAVTKAVKEKETALKAEHQKELDGLKIRDAALSKLREAGAIDAELIYDSPKFDRTKLAFGADGKLSGVDDLIKSWKTDKPNLFSKTGDGDGEGEGGDGTFEGTGMKGSKTPNQAKGGALDRHLDAIFGGSFVTFGQ